MPQFFSNKRLIVLLVSIIVLVALIGYSLRNKANISWPEQFVKDIVGLGQSVVSKPAGAITNFFEDIQNLKNTYQENEKLKAHLAQLGQIESEVNQLKKDNQELRAVLKKQESLSDYSVIQATVIARNPDRWFDLVTIDKGKAVGVKPGMAVQTANGLIGKVKSAAKFTASVELLSAQDPKNRISAVIQSKKNVYGLIEGYDQDKGYLLLKDIPFNAKIKKGDSVITSGLGGVFPKGLLIGKVKKLVPDQFGLTQTAYIKPAADMYDLEHVMVVKRKMRTASMASDNSQQQQSTVDGEGEM